MVIDLKALSDRERLAWRMRFQYGWRIRRIALAMGITPSGASRALARAMQHAGLPKVRLRIRRTKPRLIRARSLSDCYNY